MSAYDKILTAVYNKLGYTLDDNIKEIILHPAMHKLIKAPAGGTKTTLSQIMLAVEKLAFIKNRLTDPNAPQALDTSEILCLVYNDHNVADVKRVHLRIYNVFESFGLFNQSLLKDNFMVSGITAATVHSHSKAFVTRYKSVLKLRKVELSNSTFLNSLLTNSFNKIFTIPPIMKQSIHELYGLYTNLLLYDNDDRKEFFKFHAEIESDSIYDQFCEVFKNYDKAKHITQSMEFSDWIKYAITLYKDFPNVASMENEKIKYLVVDEVQDFTPIMVEYLKCLIHPNAKIIIIGDSDQTIYQFNGADHTTLDNIPLNTDVNFTKFYLDTNRRCAEKSLVYARKLLTKMNDREDYSPKTISQDGEFVTMNYQLPTEEVDNVLQHFDSQYYTTNAFLFRTRDRAIPLTRSLYKQNRPYSLFNATSFHQHPFYKGFLETVKCVFVFQDRSIWNQLHRILPITKKKLNEFLVFDSLGNPTAFPEILRWSKLDFLQTRKTYNMADSWFWQLMFAKGLAENIEHVASRDIVDLLIDMYSKNYYNYLNQDTQYLDDIKEMIKEDFDTSNSLRWLIPNLESKIAHLVSNKQIHNINVCTIHATKGLEFDRVYLMSLEDDDHQFDSQTELRLFYVGATRQRKSLVLSINSLHPHKLATTEYIVSQQIEIENRFDISPVNDFNHLFENNYNPNVRR